ncbi:Type IV secretory system Conjugative DNA transfer [Clostridium formicaceticum]|uniref:Conjugal transfer protein TraG n=1 Tax=Clostridium formicaceticum TaxID=1497 RepID=A0AAC9RP29_9CLOT|nr:conjugal transfer protein TraG [Clostridium formicaceticum]ARE89132.1 Type IV secretory system Conjugative DNA transfer [Clostridium formicaceticum]
MIKLNTKILKKNLVFNSPLILIGVVMNWVSFISRTDYQGNIILAIGEILNSPAVVLKALPLSFNPVDLIVASSVTLILLLLILEKRANQKKFRKGVEHGSARWGTAEDIKPYVDDDMRNNIILSETEFLTMSSRPKSKELIEYARNKNIIVIGGSGSGKTRFFIKPNIMQMHSSYVVTDPKGTIVNEVSTMLLKHGYKVKILNLVNLSKSMRYNPMAYIKNEEDILKLVDTIIENTKGEGEKAGEDFWVKAEKLLYQAFIGAIFYEFPDFEKNLISVVEMLKMCETREDDETFKNSVDLWFEELEQKNPDHFAVIQYKNYKLAAGKTAKSILISCAARLAPFNIPRIRDLVKEDEMELNKIGDEKTALFAIIPDTNRTFNFIISMMYTQMFNTLCTHADDDCGGRLPIHVRFMLDEFANIGKIPDFDILIATIRSREMSASIVLQSKRQLKSVYGEDKAAIIEDCCDTTIFLGGKSKDTMKDIVETLGKETIDDFNTSDTRGSNLSKGLNYSKLGRELMTLDEMAVMRGRKCIVQIRGTRPFFSNKYEITDHPMYKYHADGLEDPRWFDVEKYVKKQHQHPISYESLKTSMKGKTMRITENIEPVQLFEGDKLEMENGGVDFTDYYADGGEILG